MLSPLCSVPPHEHDSHHCHEAPYCNSPGFPRPTPGMYCSSGESWRIVSTTSGDASPLSPICVRPCVRLPHVGSSSSSSSSSSSYGCCCCLHRRSPTSTPVTAATANGAASVASRPQGRELALKKTAFERRKLGEGDMLLLPSQTVDPAATATPYSDATQVGASY